MIFPRRGAAPHQEERAAVQRGRRRDDGRRPRGHVEPEPQAEATERGLPGAVRLGEPVGPCPGTKHIGAAGAWSGGSAGVRSAPSNRLEDHMVDEAREVRGTCPMDCPDTCSWIVTVRGDKAVRLRGDADHPVTRSVLCAKMNEYIQYTQHPERLMHPLRRVGAKGEGRFERIGWDEAIAEIGGRWVRIREEFGGEAIWPYYGDGSFGLLQGVHGAGRRLFNAIGASKHGMTICTIAGGVGTHYTIGDRKVGMDPETLRYSKLIILWGTNTLTTNHHLWRTIIAARENGAKLIVIDPVRTRTATEADQHIAPRPGTD